MAELTSVNDILGLDDDDMLLDEMGADFNILEYADPELEALAGEKSNIFLDLDLEEEPVKKDGKPDAPKTEGEPRLRPQPTSQPQSTTSESKDKGKILILISLFCDKFLF